MSSHKGRPRQTISRRVAVTFAECATDYLADCRARNLGGRTIEHYGRALTLLQASLPVGDVWHTTSATPRAVAAMQERGYSRASLSMYLRAWRAFLRFCIREELVSEDLARYIKPPKAEPRRDTILSPSDVERLILAAQRGANGERDRALLTLMFDTGLRAGEVCGLTVANVNFGARVLTVPTGKTGGRSVPIGRTTAKALRAWLRVHPTGEGALFPSARTGEALTPQSLRQCFTRIGTRAHLKVHPHQLRHSFSVVFLRGGGDTFTLQRVLGHRTLEMTKWYSTLNDADVQAKHDLASPADRLGRK